jgi:hypothetical protein
MKIIGITSIGTFYSPWFPYTIASIYNICDEIVISNIGFNMNNPQPYQLVPLAKVTEEIKRIDVNHKIVELKNFHLDKLSTKLTLMTQKEANDTNAERWFDIRGVGATAANEEAIRRKADWILKTDTDQACYKDLSNLRHFLHVFPANGLKFRQYEFCGDIGGTEFYETVPPPGPYNDSVFIYKAYPGQYYAGGMAPVLNLPYEDRLSTDVFHAAHLRMCNPIWLTDKEKYEHFYGRAWFRNYTNNYGKFCNELNEQSKKDAYHWLENGHQKLTDIKPPGVCFYKDPLEYIKNG